MKDAAKEGIAHDLKTLVIGAEYLLKVNAANADAALGLVIGVLIGRR